MARKKNNSDSDKNKDNTGKAAIEEKRQIIISSINFWNEHRNRALFQISSARLKQKNAKKEEELAQDRARMAKKRLISEIEKNLDILKSGDAKDFYIEEDNEEQQ